MDYEQITSAGQSRVGVGVHKEFHVEQVANRLEVENQYTLEQNHISGIDGNHIFGTTAIES